MNAEKELFQTETVAVSRWLVLIKRILLLIVAIHLIIGVIAAYRVYFQLHSLEIATDPILQSGSNIKTTLVTYGRTLADVRLELVQNGKSLTLYEQPVGRNEFGFYDPRRRTASFSVAITPQLLDQFDAGAATVRATAVGRPQWTQLPPTLVREIGVTIRSDK